MLRHVLALTLLLAGIGAPAYTAAQAADVDPASFLPPDTRIVTSIRGDVDGDGQDDLVVLYSEPRPTQGPASAGVMVLAGGAAQPRPVHLFGAPPDLRGEPVLEPNLLSDLAIHDLVGQGHGQIVLRLTRRVREQPDHQEVWIFDRDPGPGEPPADPAPMRPTWAGTGFRLAAHLEGAVVEVTAATPGSPATLRRQAVSRELGGTDSGIGVSETYTWRGGGYRLAERSLTLAPDAVIGASPETTVLGFYAALGRNDLQAAIDLLGDDLQASRSSTARPDPTAPSPALRVEELRHVDSRDRDRPGAEAERTMYVRASLADPGLPDAPGVPTLAAPASGAPGGQAARRHAFAGTWRLRQEGGGWRLIGADLRETVGLAAVADALPSGTEIVETASGDLRGTGATDVVALVSAPGRYALLEPYVLLAGPSGLEPGRRLATFVDPEAPPGVGGTVLVEDVNQDGRPEIVFSAVVGAHSSLLWVVRWDGTTLRPLFAQGSNAPVIALEHLDDDRIPEIVLVQSGYCGGYASSPMLAFAFRWQDGAYRSASARYPSLNDGLDDHAAELLERDEGTSERAGDRACVQHMLATAHAFRDRPAEARAAYRAYAELRQQAPADSREFVKPAYVGAPYVADDLRAIISAAGAGTGSSWDPAELAVLHDLLGDALTARARNLEYEAEAEAAERNGQTAEAEAARAAAAEASRAAEDAYRAALSLDPTDAEARRNLGE